MKLFYFRSFGTKLSLIRLRNMVQSSATSLANLEIFGVPAKYMAICDHDKR